MGAIPIIAIDGPSASGKGSVAARVAAALGWHYLDSGALYRLTALAATQHGVALGDEANVAAIAASLDVAFLEGMILLEGEDATELIRTEAVGEGASKVAVLPSVRRALLQRQRDFARAPGLVADGRDMGSVIFPEAQLKIFLTASAGERANRRYKQLIAKGEEATISRILLDIEQRDARDRARAVAPLRQIADARLLDTTEMSIEKAVQIVLDGWREISAN
ncbi:(d)CMP kinase [Chitinimonas sp. BJB300]|uniref:(d)CMP kinase n=1 Tax=Chitinimonas sp. BJB300 TaxID=1559339 RepID=UPI000C0DECBF|nr:(d)CMP kinase [Chitinimonas sp. BJB300]PHV11374.1 cytidylate kinase [Chitinimonas sp. BJB300]TSJ88907.1 (d)CMP kinase [Chitinimonas sp. BJB300]